MASSNGSRVEAIEEKIRELVAQREDAVREEQENIAKENFEEARTIIDRLKEDMFRLKALGYLPPILARELVGKNGKFAPGNYIKRPARPR